MYTVEQIRKAGAEGEISSIDIEHLITVLNELYGSNVSQNSGNAIVSGALPPSESEIDDAAEVAAEEEDWYNCPKDMFKAGVRWLLARQ